MHVLGKAPHAALQRGKTTLRVFRDVSNAINRVGFVAHCKALMLKSCNAYKCASASQRGICFSSQSSPFMMLFPNPWKCSWHARRIHVQTSKVKVLKESQEDREHSSFREAVAICFLQIVHYVRIQSRRCVTLGVRRGKEHEADCCAVKWRLPSESTPAINHLRSQPDD